MGGLLGQWLRVRLACTETEPSLRQPLCHPGWAAQDWFLAGPGRGQRWQPPGVRPPAGRGERALWGLPELHVCDGGCGHLAARDHCEITQPRAFHLKAGSVARKAGAAGCVPQWLWCPEAGDHCWCGGRTDRSSRRRRRRPHSPPSPLLARCCPGAGGGGDGGQEALSTREPGSMGRLWPPRLRLPGWDPPYRESLLQRQALSEGSSAQGTPGGLAAMRLKRRKEAGRCRVSGARALQAHGL